MSKTAIAVSEIAAGVALMVLTSGGGIGIAAAWTTQTLSTLFAIGLSAGITGVFGLLQPLLNPNDTSVPGSEQNYQNSAAFRRVVYGYMEVGGVLTYDSAPAGNNPYQNQGAQDNWRHQVYTLTGHQISSFQRGGKYHVVIDGIDTPLVADPGTGYYYPEDELDPYGGTNGWHIAFEFDLGNPDAPQAFGGSDLLSQACPDWLGSCVQKGCAKVHVAMRYDNLADGSQVGVSNMVTSAPIYVSGRVPTFRFQVTGKPLLDPRSSTGGTATWQANTPYQRGQYVLDPSQNVELAGGVYSPFESGPTQPTWPAIGLVVVDGQVWWKNCGPVRGAWGPGLNIPGNNVYVIRDPNGNLQMSGDNAFITGSTEPDFSTVTDGYTADGNGYWVCLGVPQGLAYSTNLSNPALIVYDYLLDTDYGMGVNPADIDVASVCAAANVCEEQVLVNIAKNGGSLRENRYACNGVFDQSAARGDVLKSLIGAMAGTVIPPGDMWHIFAGAYISPTAALTDADLRDSIKADFRISRRDLCNGVKGSFIPAFLPCNTTQAIPGHWRWTDFPPYQGNGLSHTYNYVAEDGGTPIWKDARFGFTTSIFMVQRLAKILMMTLRFQVTINLACKLTAFPIQAGDTITFTHARWAALASPPPTIFFVTQATLVIENRNGVPALGVDLVLREHDPAVYEFTAPLSLSDQGEYSAYASLGTIGG